MNEIALNKKISIERCLSQISKYDAVDHGVPFEQDYLKQDAIAMNLQRACELAIDLANYAIKTKKLGLPQDSRDSFELLKAAKIITPELSDKLKAMVGFRNVLVHEYQVIDLNIMRSVVQQNANDLLIFANVLVGFLA